MLSVSTDLKTVSMSMICKWDDIVTESTAPMILIGGVNLTFKKQVLIDECSALIQTL
jgi:hypothetical protein